MRTQIRVSLLLLLLPSFVWSQQRDPEQYAKMLEGAERVAKLQVPRVVEALELRPGMRVADLGSGSGLFTRPLARAVGDTGTVYAVDIDEGMLKIVARSAAEQKIANIKTVLATPDEPKLPEPVDLVFICDTLHHISGQAAYLKTLRGHVKPGGRVAVIDFGAQWPQGHESMRYGTAQLDEWMKAAGFTASVSHGFLDNSFFIVYH